MIDHGLEDMDERLATGKPEIGTIACHVERLGEDMVRLTVSDDGRGIDVARVLAKAAEKGLVASDPVADMAPEAVFELLFRDDFSTRDEVSLLSGRGVGLAAVRAETERLGGTVRVRSEVGRGSQFVFTLPLFPDEALCGTPRMAA